MTMSYLEAAPGLGDLRGMPDTHQPLDDHSNPGVLDLQKRLSTVALASNVENPNQVYAHIFFQLFCIVVFQLSYYASSWHRERLFMDLSFLLRRTMSALCVSHCKVTVLLETQ